MFCTRCFVFSILQRDISLTSKPSILNRSIHSNFHLLHIHNRFNVYHNMITMPSSQELVLISIHSTMAVTHTNNNVDNIMQLPFADTVDNDFFTTNSHEHILVNLDLSYQPYRYTDY